MLYKSRSVDRLLIAVWTYICTRYTIRLYFIITLMSSNFRNFFLIFRIFDDFEQCPHALYSAFLSIWCIRRICRYTRVCAAASSLRELTADCQKPVSLLKSTVEMLFADMSKAVFQQSSFLDSTVNNEILNICRIFQHSFQHSAE